jgi:hypothetical protein
MGSSLITLAEYKAYAGITSPNQDTVINAIIPKVSELVKSYCRRTFVDYYDDPKSELFNGGDKLLLTETPVASVTSVEYSADYGQTYTTLTKFTDWAYDPYYVAIVPITTKEFPLAVSGYRVTYNAGYDSLPDDLKLAVMDLVTYYRKNDGSVHSPKAPGTNTVQIEYISTTTLPAHIRRILDMYVADYS